MTENTKKIQQQESPHAGHRERLRQRFLKNSILLSDYEIIELALGYVLKRGDTKPQAKALDKKFQSIRALIDSPIGLLRKEPNLGIGVETFFLVLREIFARYAEAPLIKHEYIATPETVASMAKIRLAGLQHEEVWIALLDNQNRLKSWDQLVQGSVNAAHFYPREALALALAKKATGIILVHNHPGGSALPSLADEDLTKRMNEVAGTMGVRFLDHIIVTEGDCYSIRQHCKLNLE